MFCTRCGTEIGQQANFCRACGTRVNHAGDAAEPGTAIRRNLTKTAWPVYDRTTVKKSVLVAAVFALMGVAGAVIYFESGLLRQPAQSGSNVVEPVAGIVQPPATVALEYSTNPGEVTEGNLAPANQPSASEVPLRFPADVPNPTSDVSRKPAPLAEVRRSARGSSPVASNASRSLTLPDTYRRSSGLGLYETVRATDVFEAPSKSSKILAHIGAGIRVNVRGGNGDWLEVYSKQGNPPGFIWREDAAPNQ